jgi:starch synthase (maltosyl-transferring)
MRIGEAASGHATDARDSQRTHARGGVDGRNGPRLDCRGLRIAAVAGFAHADEARLARLAALGFNALLIETAPTAGSVSALASALPQLVGNVSARAHAQGLALLVDVDLHCVDAAWPATQACPAWFRRETIAEWPVDPRRDLHAPEFLPRFDFPDAAKGIAAQYVELLGTAAALGVDGFGIQWPQYVPSGLMRGILDALCDSLFIAWAPGLTRSERLAFAAAGFHAGFCSLPWWDFRAPWFSEELDDLRRSGFVIAPVDVPHDGDHERGERALRRQLDCAQAAADGWLLRLPHESHEDLPAEGDLLATDIAAVNRRFAEPDRPRPAIEIVNAPWSRVGAWIERNGAAHELILLNSDLDHHAVLETSALEAYAGVVVGAVAVPLGPAEVQCLVLPEPVPIPETPAADALARAIDAPRVAIENITPTVDEGRFAAKATLGETVIVEADVFADGHPALAVRLLWRTIDTGEWNLARMRVLDNDRWRGEFLAQRLGTYVFTIEAGFDEFGSLRSDLEKKAGAGQDVSLEVREAIHLIQAAAGAAPAPLPESLRTLAREVEAAADPAARVLAPDCAELMAQAAGPAILVRLPNLYRVVVDRRAARFAAWYELFPRSQGRPGEHGTFADVIAQLPRVAAMGFDVLYFTPIHPVGATNRKGRNNALRAEPGEPGSTYAIGDASGGHDAVHPQLGTLGDFRQLVAAAREHGLEIALDFAIQCSPDHPWIREHPEWFAWRPDGSLRFAENPPKKYEDIVNVDFYARGAKPQLWTALRDIVAFWMRQGVRTFRVDNPHTKPLPFWEWLIADLRAIDPEVIFLSEAFTRPKPMYRLAKLGFTQSYTYFTWRNTRSEFETYLTELNTAPVRDFYRPHFFVNTPDINPIFLQTSGRPGFLIRAALAATMSGLWGMYSGFELCEGTPLPGREEYLDSEKYELRHRDWNAPGNIVAEIAQLNRIRRENPALHSHLGITFYNCTNPLVIWFGKSTPTRDNVVLVAISLDPSHVQEAQVELPLWEWELDDTGTLCAEDLVDDRSFDWHGKAQTIVLDPAANPYRIWRVRSERER